MQKVEIVFSTNDGKKFYITQGNEGNLSVEEMAEEISTVINDAVFIRCDEKIYHRTKFVSKFEIIVLEDK